MNEPDDRSHAPGTTRPSPSSTSQGRTDKGRTVDNRGAVIAQQIVVQGNPTFVSAGTPGEAQDAESVAPLTQLTAAGTPDSRPPEDLETVIGSPESSEPGTPAGDKVLAEHRDHLVRQLSPVKILRNIAENKAGHRQSKIRLQDVFVCPRLVPEEVQERLEALDRRLLDRGPGRDRSESAQYGEQVRWEPERWVASSMSVGRALAQHRTLMVVGDPGTGKSTLLAALVLATVSEHSSQELADAPGDVSLHGRMPFFLRLPQLASQASREVPDLCRALAESVAVPTPLEHALKLVEHALRTDHAIVLLDALDEVPSSTARDRIADAIESLCSTHSRCFVVVTTREGGRTMIPGFTTVHLSPMTQHGVGRFISVWRKALGKTTALEFPSPGKVEALGELGRNPLMLLIMLMTGDVELPHNKRVLFYRRALRTMFTTWRGSSDDEHDPATKQAWRAWGEVALGLRCDDSGGVLPRPALERRLSEALATEGANDAEALASRMVEEAWRESGFLTKRGDELGFWHSTFGEYLAATALARDMTLDRFMALRRDHRNVEVAVMTIDYLAYGEHHEARASACLRALLEQRDPQDDLDGAQIEFAVKCVLRGCYARPEVIDLCFETVLRLCREFPYGKTHRWCLSRLVQSLPRHAMGQAVLPALAELVNEEDPPVDLDIVAVLLSAASPREPALAACEALLRRTRDRHSWPDKTPMRRAYAALGLVRGGRLEPRLLEVLTGLRWFDTPSPGSHGLSPDDLQAEASDGTFVGALQGALGTREQQVLWEWRQTEDVTDRASVCLLLALAVGTHEPEDAVVFTLIHVATHEERTDVRENAREMVARIALHHSRVGVHLLKAALSAGPDVQRRTVVGAVRESDPRNWAQKLLGRVASASPAMLTWLVDEVARAAFRAQLEQRDDLALPFLRHLLRDVEGASSAFEDAVLQRSNEQEHWPRLAAFLLLLDVRHDGPPHPALWLACACSEDPWFRLVALERWCSVSRLSEPVADELVEGFVDACDHLLALRPNTSPAPDDALAGLSKADGQFLISPNSFGTEDPRRAVVRCLQTALSGRTPLATQSAAAMWQRLIQAKAVSSTMLAVLLAEHGHAGDHPGLVDMLRAGLTDNDAAAAARAAVWFAKHERAPARPPAEELQWAMLRGSTNETIYNHAEMIRKLGPPSEALLGRMIQGGHDHLVMLEPSSTWVFSNPHALGFLIKYLHGGASAEQCHTVIDLLRTDLDNESIDAVLFERARTAPPEACFHITQALEIRHAHRSPGATDPRLDKLWIRALASDRPASLLSVLESMRGWSQGDQYAITRAYRICLGAEDAMIRIYAILNLIRWTPSGAPLRDVLPRVTGAIGLTAEEVITSLEECLDDPVPHPRLFASSLLLGLSASLEACERALRELATPGDEALVVRLGSFPRAELSVVRVMERTLTDLLARPDRVLDAVLGEAATSSDAASLLHWVFFNGPLPARVAEMLRGLGESPTTGGWPSSRDPSGAAVALARCPRAHVREPARRAIVEVLRSRPETSELLHDDALLLLPDDPEFLDPLMDWCLRRTEIHWLRQQAEVLHRIASEQPQVMPWITEWLLAVLATETTSPRSDRTEAAIRLAVLLRIDDEAVCRAWLVLIATSERYQGLADTHVAYFRTQWRELPLRSEQLLQLVRMLDRHQPNPCPDVCSNIVAHFLTVDDPEVKLDALDVWARGSNPADQLERALRAWRELGATAGFPVKDGACSLALDLIEHDPTAEDLIEFLEACVQDRELWMDYRLKALSAIEGVPAKRAWVETTAYELLGSSDGEGLGEVANWLLDRLPADADELPLALARAMAGLSPTGWSPSSLRYFDRWPHSDPRTVPLTNTPFDRTFAQIFAELLPEDAGTLRALFDDARGNDPLSSDQREHILRVLRVQSTDDPTTRLARRWWHHQLRLNAQANDLIP